ncbi:hypothetical protein Ciccas_007507 [Cichlidogyrus casuarinus]|uniref:Hook C-terminal domain-containing protein n=1 Tax=Cichlidogyrus casuarinus TaxID=1844966 RepID=A0ABD2Q3F6_9PLAT
MLCDHHSEYAELRIEFDNLTSKHKDLSKKHDQSQDKLSELKNVSDELDFLKEDLHNSVKQIHNSEKLRHKAEEMNAESRLRVTILEHENRVCLQRIEELESASFASKSRPQHRSIHQDSDLSSLLDEANRRSGYLETELLAANKEKVKTLIELQRLRSFCEQFVDNLSGFGAISECAEGRALLHSLCQELEKSNSDIEFHSGRKLTTNSPGLLQINSVDAPTLASELTHAHLSSPSTTTISTSESSEMSLLRTQLIAKETEMIQKEQKYRMFLVKAREVIKRLASNQFVCPKCDYEQEGDAPAVTDEIEQLKRVVADKEAIIGNLEQYFEKYKTDRESEQRSVMSAWNHLVIQMNRQSACTSSAKEHENSFKAPMKPQTMLEKLRSDSFSNPLKP